MEFEDVVSKTAYCIRIDRGNLGHVRRGPRMRLHLIQHGLADEHSHYAGEASAWHKALQGSDSVAYSNAALPQELAQALGAIPCFPYVADAVLDADPISREVADYLVLSQAFAQACQQQVSPRLAGNDLVLVTYCTQRELFGAALWLQTVPAHKRPRMAFIFHTPDLLWQVAPDRKQVAGPLGSWRHAARMLAGVLPAGRCCLAATNAALAQVLGKLLLQRVEVVPLVLPLQEPLALPGKRFDLALAGQWRPEKGSELGPALVAELARLRPGLVLSLHLNQLGQVSVFEAHANRGQIGLDVIEGYCNQHDYTERLLASRVLLLPYFPARYALRASGVAWEAFAYGVPVVCPSGTWMADQVSAGSAAGLVFGQWNAAEIAAAALRALDQLPALTQQAARLKPGWCQGSGARTVLDRVVQALELAR